MVITLLLIVILLGVEAYTYSPTAKLRWSSSTSTFLHTIIAVALGMIVTDWLYQSQYVTSEGSHFLTLMVSILICFAILWGIMFTLRRTLSSRSH